MVSHRKRKKTAEALGLTNRELEFTELVEELLESVRWLQILGYSNQYFMTRFLKVPKAERDKILEAATRAVDRDSRLHEWQERLARLKGEMVHAQRGINRQKREMTRGAPAPSSPFSDEEGR